MRPAAQTLADQFHQMRERCLSLAADLDRIERSPGGPELLKTDPNLIALRQAIEALLQPGTTRAQNVQSIFSDKTPPPRPLK